MSKVTMQDIADALGVSRVSVWKVFNDQPGVSNTLKHSILDMASKLGYNSLSAITVSNKDMNNFKNVSLVCQGLILLSFG